MSIPKVSKMKAGLLLESFGNLGNIAKATEEELTSINGIGPTLGRNIYDYWR
jgi:ERCC4-type nuclease